jgi:hypothetical protein
MLKSAVAVYGLGFFVLAAGGSVWAAVPITTIQRWQEAAPEVVGITVLSVDQVSRTLPYHNLRPDGSVTTIDFTLKARVDIVHRTISGLAPGSTIAIQYSARRYEPISPPDGNYGTILQIDGKAKAYLKKRADDTYELSCDVGCLETL